MHSVLAALTFATAWLPQEPGTTTGPGALEMLPLAPFTTLPPMVEPLPWRTLLTRDRGREADFDLLGTRSGREPQLATEVWLRLLGAVDPAAIEANQLRLGTQGHTLLVAGHAANVKAVREEWQALQAVLGRPLQLEIAVWEAPSGEPPAAILDAAGYADFTAGRTPRWRAQRQTRSGVPVVAQALEWQSYLHDIDVEVAEKAQIADPGVSAFGSGCAVAVLPQALAGGDCVVTVQYLLGTPHEELRPLALGLPDTPDLQQPSLETCFGATSARLPPGGAMAVTLAGDAGTGSRSVVTVRWSGPALPQPTGHWLVLPVSALSDGYLLHEWPQLPPIGSPELEVSGQTLTAAALHDLLRQALGTADGEVLDLEHEGGHLFLRGTAAQRATATTLLRRLEDQLLQNATVRHRAVTSPDAASKEPAAVLGDLQFPTLLGRVAIACRIRETAVVRDFEVEIAKEATMRNPVVGELQLGAWLQCCVQPHATGRQLRLAAKWQHGSFPGQERLHPVGMLMLPRVAIQQLAHDGPVTPGQALEHGHGPEVRLDGRACRSAAVTIVR